MATQTWKGKPVEIGLVDIFDGSPERSTGFIRSFAQTVEDLGFTGIWLPEHILFFDHYESTYPYPAVPSASDPNVTEMHNATVDGKPRVEVSEDQGLLDIFQSALEACSVTDRLRFGSSVMLLPLRNPRAITRELMTLSELTGDRFDFGVGVGWSSEELEACETDFPSRGKRHEAMMIEVQRLWGDEEGLYPEPSHPFPRMLVGGHSPAAIRRAAQVATGWYPWNLTLPQFSEHYATYRRHLEASSRDIDAQKVVAGLRFNGDVSQLPAIVDGYVERGADAVNVSLRVDTVGYAEQLAAVAAALGLSAG